MTLYSIGPSGSHLFLKHIFVNFHDAYSQDKTIYVILGPIYNTAHYTLYTIEVTFW